MSTLDLAKVVTHRRFKALGETAQAFYLELLRDAAPSGLVPTEAVRRMWAARAFGRAAVSSLIDADLLTINEDGPGFYLVAPAALEQAEEFALLAGVSPFDATVQRAAWRRHVLAAIEVAEAEGALGTLSLEAWNRLVDAEARREAEQ